MRIAVALVLSLIAVGCGSVHKEQVQSRQRQVCSQSTQTPIEIEAAKVDVLDHHDVYHVIVFSYQNNGFKVNPVQTHTFASWVHTRNKQITDQVDISWGPMEGQRVLLNEPDGCNRSLASTLDDMKLDRKLGYWVMRTDKTFFDAAIKQRENLKFYRAVDNKSRPTAVNCIHACSDVAGYLDTKLVYGIAAGKMVSDYYVQMGKAWPCHDDWIIPIVMKTNNCNFR